VTIDERSDETAIDIAGDRDVIRLGTVDADRLLPIPIALDLQSVLVQSPTAVTIVELVRIIVLDCLFSHRARVPSVRQP
jgi:hypothetical protein